MKTGFFQESLSPSATQHKDALDRRILREQVNSLLGTSTSASVGAFITAAGFCVIFYPSTSDCS